MAEALDTPIEGDEDFKVVENDDGSADVVTDDADAEAPDDAQFYTENLVKKLSDERREEIVVEYLRLIDKDKKAREKHDEQCKKALESTGLTGEAVPAFEGGSTLVHPILAKISVDFSSHAIKEIFPAEGPVRTNIPGKATRKKLEVSERKRRHMNWQLTRQIEEYRNNLEQMLPVLALCGSQYIRMYWWEKGQRPRSEYISSDKIYLPYTVGSFYSTQRLTYEETISDMEYDMRVINGMYDDDEDGYELEDGTEISNTPDISEVSKTERQMRKIEGKNPEDEDGEETRIVYNVYCYMKLSEDSRTKEKEYAPYIMAINKATQKMVALYRNWEHDDETMQAMQWIVEWPMIPWGHSVYTIGAGHLVGQLARGASGALRCLLDSGLANTAPTALKTKSMGVSGQSKPIKIGSINEVNTNAGLDDIRKSLTTLPFNPPSNVLYELLGFLVTTAGEVARSTVDEVADATTNTPVGTTLSRIEQGMVVFSAIHARLHDAQRRTLEVLHRINRMHMDPDVLPPTSEQAAAAMEDEPLAYQEDYEGVMDVCPVSDPNIFSETQRFSQAQAVYALAKENPGLIDIKAAVKRMFSAMKIQAIDELMPDPTAPHDENPAAENIKMGMGQPAQALPTQDHLAHLQTHLDFLQSPAYGKNEAILSALAAPMLTHLVQHLILNYGEMMQDKIKAAVAPDYDGDMNELIGEDGAAMNELSKVIAAASPMVTEESAKLFEKALPMIQELLAYVKQNTPPPPMDPSQAMLKVEQMRSETEDKKLQVKAQGDQQKDKTKQADTAQKNQLKGADMQQKAQTSDKKLAQDAMATHMDAEIKEEQMHIDLLKNTQDNETALDIASMRVETGKGTGNLKDGSSLDNNP
jgi:hypothetical protein